MPTSPRLFLFDYLRAFVILMVVLHHSALAYAVHGVSWWYVRDSMTSPVFDIFVLINDVFMMPVLFFIAGYFAWPSLKSKGIFRFLKDKFFRLILPFAFGILFLGPITGYIRHLAKGNAEESYLHYWFSTYFTKEFEHFHFWFLSSLFIFFVGFCILYHLLPKLTHMPRKTMDEHSIAEYSISFGTLLAFAASTGILFFITSLFFKDHKWVNLSNVLIFQPTRSILYVSYFCLGILGFHKRWFISNGKYRFFSVWLFGMFMLAVGITIFKATLPVPSSVISKFLYALLHSFLCLNVFVVIMDLFRRNFNKPSHIKQQLSLNAYGIYLIHMNFVVLFQFVFHNFALSSFVKFVLVSTLGFLISYIICEYGLRRAPVLRKVLY